MEPLTFPAYRFQFRKDKNRSLIFDDLRKKWVALTPEEWVRQHVIEYLKEEKQVPAGLIGIEKGFQFQGMQRRADVIVHKRDGKPVLMVECKAPAVKIEQAVFDQIARYNLVIHARYLFVTNGLQHYCYSIDEENKKYKFLNELPDFEQM